MISVLLWIFGAGVVSSVAPGTAAAVVIAGVVAVIAYKTVKLVEFLKIMLHELVIETASGSHRGLISNNGSVVTDLSFRITDAINNPRAEFQMRVENFHVGDQITVSGSQNVGKIG